MTLFILHKAGKAYGVRSQDRSYPGEGKGAVTRGNKGDFQGRVCDLDAGYGYLRLENPTCTLMNCTLLNMCIKIFLLRYKESSFCGRL